MNRYIYEREHIEGEYYPYYIYDTTKGLTMGQEIARANEATVAQKIVDAMNAFEQRRSRAA
jgi:hypothetical protein